MRLKLRAEKYKGMSLFLSGQKTNSLNL